MPDLGPLPERPADDDWRSAAALSRGERVSGTVTSHRHFGFFVSLSSSGLPGLVLITHYRSDARYDAAGVLHPGFPEVGARVEAEVLGLRERERQVELRYVDPAADAEE